VTESLSRIPVAYRGAQANRIQVLQKEAILAAAKKLIDISLCTKQLGVEIQQLFSPISSRGQIVRSLNLLIPPFTHRGNLPLSSTSADSSQAVDSKDSFPHHDL